MKRVVWKFPFEVADEFYLRMPAGAEILHVDVQSGQPCLWVLVDSDRPTVARGFRLAGTGHTIGDYSPAWKFVGTFLVHGGALVFHLWDCGDGT